MHSTIRKRNNRIKSKRGRFKVKRYAKSIKLRVARKLLINRKNGLKKSIGQPIKRLGIRTSSNSASSSMNCLKDNNLTKFAKTVLNAFSSIDGSDQVNIWREMISQHPFNLNQLRTLQSAIDDRIKVDIISNVPYEIARYIMSFLGPEDLCQAAQTCRSWRVVCEDNRLWREKCEEEGILDDNLTLEQLFRKRIFANHNRQENYIRDYLDNSNSSKSEWKTAYLKHMDVLRNWRTRHFLISVPFIAASPLQQRIEQRIEQRIPPLVALRQSAGPARHRAELFFRHNPLQRERFEELQRIMVLEEKHEEMRRQLHRYRQIRHQHQQIQQQQPQEQQEQEPPQREQPQQQSKQQQQESPEQPDAAGSAGPTSNQQNMNANHDNRFSEQLASHFKINRYMQLRCHEDSVITCLQFNPKTNTIVSGSDDQTLKVWCSATGRCISTLEGHLGGVWSSQLSPDDIVVSGSTDRTLKVWKAHTGDLLHTLHGHTSTVRCLALDGNQVVSGSRDTTLRLWNIVDGECIHVLCGHSAAVRCVEYKNNIIVSGAYDHLVMVWDALTGACVHALESHFSRIYSLQFDGKTIASGSLDSTICVWDASTGKLRHQLEGHTSLTSKMQLKGNLLVSANADSYCKVWNVNTGECLQTLGGDFKHTSAITSVYFNNRHVVTSSDDGTVKLWDLRTGKFIRDLIVLPTASRGGVVWRIRASYTKLICAVGSRTQTEDTHLLVLDFNE